MRDSGQKLNEAFGGSVLVFSGIVLVIVGGMAVMTALGFLLFAYLLFGGGYGGLVAVSVMLSIGYFLCRAVMVAGRWAAED